MKCLYLRGFWIFKTWLRKMGVLNNLILQVHFSHMLPKSQRNVPATNPSPRCLERYRVLREADEIGSVSEVCRRTGITRQTFYLWKKRYAASGLLGLEDRPSKPSPGRPSSVNAIIMSIMIEHVRKNPEVGCLSMANHLAELGIRISPPTVQKYLNRWRLGSQQSRVRWIQSGCPHIELSGPSRSPVLPVQEIYKWAKSYYFSGIPKQDGGGIEIRYPSLTAVALALRAPLADIQAIADREHWVESREKLLVLLQAKSPTETEKEESLVRRSAVGGEAAIPESSSWQSILFKAIASTPIARHGMNPVQSESGPETESSPEIEGISPSEGFKRRAAYWMERWPRMHKSQ